MNASPASHAPAQQHPPKDNVPSTKEERDRLAQIVYQTVKEWALVPPLSAEDLRQRADQIIAQASSTAQYREYIAILINNALWRPIVASIPFQRRLLLLPKCLHSEKDCKADIDELGLLCKQCGRCHIHGLQHEAEQLGYAVLVAEGSTLVTKLIQEEKIDAVIGVSCVAVLERAFPYMEAAAIPGIAIPLLQDGCIHTTLDMDWAWDAIHLTTSSMEPSTGQPSAYRTSHSHARLDLTTLRKEVDSWFTPESLTAIMGPPRGHTEQLARTWLTRGGKRWRPFLAVAVFQSLRNHPEEPLPDDLRKLAVSVECFHKASLIHDDIEDDDSMRYGEKTLHEKHGVPVALNAGDLLIGEGYRMIDECQVNAEQKAAMLHVAVDGHRKLCRGQGEELAWIRAQSVLTQEQILEIFCLKTAPAFEVAMRLGALCANRHEPFSDVIGAFSEALGVAYQIRDDLHDFDAPSGLNIARPSLLLATAHDHAQHLLETYKKQAVASLQNMTDMKLKSLLRRIVGKIFNNTDTNNNGWQHEFSTRHVTSRPARRETTG